MANSGRIVVVLTHSHDRDADRVVAGLAKHNVPVFRFHTAEFPMGATLVSTIGEPSSDGWSGSLTFGPRTLALEDVRSIWYRRPTRFTLAPHLTELERQFARNEARHGLGGVLRASAARWVNHPHNETAANYKPVQLAIASEIGLEVPRTLITNDAPAARAFVRGCATGAIYKTLTGIARGGGYVAKLYTSQVAEADLEDDSAIEQCVCMFQERLLKRLDLRVTIVGDDIFPVAISTDDGVLDWRSSMEMSALRHKVHPLPPDLQERLLRLVRALGLEFGAIDLVQTLDGRYVFLEVNPGGAWSWLEVATGAPITESLVRLLMSERDPQPIITEWRASNV